jgi:hypothetical protein
MGGKAKLQGGAGRDSARTRERASRADKRERASRADKRERASRADKGCSGTVHAQATPASGRVDTALRQSRQRDLYLQSSEVCA